MYIFVCVKMLTPKLQNIWDTKLGSAILSTPGARPI